MNSESLVENQLAEDKLQGEEIVAQRESSDEGEDQVINIHYTMNPYLNKPVTLILDKATKERPF